RTIAENKSIKQCAVLLRSEDHDNSYLVAYITHHTNYSRAELLNSLTSKLPSYMIPMRIVELEAFPLTYNGKIDRTKLPSPTAQSLFARSFVPPATSQEIKMA